MVNRQAGERVIDALQDGAAKFKRALKDRQGDAATGIRRQVERIRSRDSELNNRVPTTRRRRRGESRAEYGEAQTRARMDDLGYSRISDPNHHPNANGIDDIFIHRDTGHVMIVESKYGRSRLGRLVDGTRQMSREWLTRPFNNHTSRIHHALPPGSVLSGDQVRAGLRRELVTPAVARIRAGDIQISTRF
jgi:hypothetical protein